jgi:hypothetical protein
MADHEKYLLFAARSGSQQPSEAGFRERDHGFDLMRSIIVEHLRVENILSKLTS